MSITDALQRELAKHAESLRDDNLTELSRFLQAMRDEGMLKAPTYTLPSIEEVKRIHYDFAKTRTQV